MPTNQYLLAKIQTVSNNASLLTDVANDYVKGKASFASLQSAHELCSKGQSFSAVSKAKFTVSAQEKIHNALKDRPSFENLVYSKKAHQVLSIITDDKTSPTKASDLCCMVIVDGCGQRIK